MAGEERDPKVIEFLREKYRLNDPVVYQYGYWLKGALAGDLGISLRTNQPVLTLVAEKLPVTIQLAVMSMIFAFVIGIPMGILAAVKKNTVIDFLANIVALCGLSVPNFWLGIMLILLISVKLHWLPASGYQPFFDDPLRSIQTMLMPSFVLGNALAATLMRHTRSSMLSVLSADYIRTARAKGLSEAAVVLSHSFRNAILPVVTVSALLFGESAGRRRTDRADLYHSRFRQAHRRCGVQPRLCRRPGCRALHGRRFHRNESHRRCSLVSSSTHA